MLVARRSLSARFFFLRATEGSLDGGVCVLRYVCFHLCVYIALGCAGGGDADPGPVYPGPIFVYTYGLLRVIPAPFYPGNVSYTG